MILCQNQGHRFRVTEAEARWNAHDGKTSKNEAGSANTLNSAQEYHTYNGQAAFGDTSAMPLGQRGANGRVLINSNTYISKQEHDNNLMENSSDTRQPIVLNTTLQ